MIRFPPGEHFPSRYDKLTGLIDVVPTLLDYLGISVPAGLDGRSVLPGLRGAGEGSRRYLLAEALAWGPERKAVITERYKYIVTYPDTEMPWLGPRAHTYDREFPTDPGAELFDLGRDPGERNDVVGSEPELAKRMDALLRPLTEAPRKKRGAVELDPSRVEALRSLGYVK